MTEPPPNLMDEISRRMREAYPDGFQFIDDDTWSSAAEPGRQITVRYESTISPMSAEAAMDYGLIPDTRQPAPPAPPIPWQTRLRGRMRRTLNETRLRVGSWIAGVDLSDRGEWL